MFVCFNWILKYAFAGGKGGIKGYYTESVGDVAFLLGLCLTWLEFKTLSFADLNLLATSQIASMEFASVGVLSSVDLIALLFALAAAAKSAQLGFHI